MRITSRLVIIFAYFSSREGIPRDNLTYDDWLKLVSEMKEETEKQEYTVPKIQRNQRQKLHGLWRNIEAKAMLSGASTMETVTEASILEAKASLTEHTELTERLTRVENLLQRQSEKVELQAKELKLQTEKVELQAKELSCQERELESLKTRVNGHERYLLKPLLQSKIESRCRKFTGLVLNRKSEKIGLMAMRSYLNSVIVGKEKNMEWADIVKSLPRSNEVTNSHIGKMTLEELKELCRDLDKASHFLTTDPSRNEIVHGCSPETATAQELVDGLSDGEIKNTFVRLINLS